MIFASTDKNKIVLENYTELWDEIKKQIELMTGDKMTKYSKTFMKVTFKTNDDLPLSKIINIPICIVIDGKYYPQVLLHDCFYEYKENINPPIV